jgi:hypothetical protein
VQPAAQAFGQALVAGRGLERGDELAQLASAFREALQKARVRASERRAMLVGHAQAYAARRGF